jgi:dolichyl-phosphate-mannose-protein mannosyltransferase
MSSNAALHQRGGKRGATDAETTPSVDAEEVINQFKGVAKETVQREWDYKLALVVITILAFITRFWGISHPNQVVFDEVHFGKVSIQLCQLKRL